MKFSRPLFLALILIISCALVRVLEHAHADLFPGATPCVALAFVAAIYLPRRWGWLVGAVAILISEPAFWRWNYLSEGHAFSSFVFISLGFYLLMGVFGALASRRPSWLALWGGPLLGSILFYFFANTLSWQASPGSGLFAYPQNFAGWVQANTTGWPGYPPSWMFLRNALGADVISTGLLVAIFDSARLSFFRRASISSAAQA